jgi:ribosome recycling factor
MAKDAEVQIQKLTDQYVTKADVLVDAKEADIMKI